MTDPDERAIVERLSVPGRMPGLSRRRFLAAGAVGAGSLALAPWLGGLRAFAAPPVGSGEGILVVVLLAGGNDGLDTVVPAGDGHYQDLRSPIALSPGKVLDLGGGLGFHPSLSALEARYHAGDVAVVRGIGYQPADLSHFESTAYWMSGEVGGSATTGWLGRYLDGLPGAAREALYGVSIGSSVPLHLVGARTQAAGLPPNLGDAFGADREDPSDARMYDTLAGFGASTGTGEWGDRYGQTCAESLDLVSRITPAYRGDRPGGDLARDLVLCARLVNLDLGVRVLGVRTHGYDNHANLRGTHDRLLADLDAAIEAFFGALDARWADRVTLMTISEFGRRPQVNGDRGTDHGAGSMLLCVGRGVRGGLHGEQPGLAPGALDRDGNLATPVDFRSVYATVLASWLGADDQEVLGGSFEKLDLFARAPGSSPPAPGRGFPDVPKTHFAYAPVAWAEGAGITTGVGRTGRFQPAAPVTRGQIATFLHRMMDTPSGSPPHHFADVDPGAYYDAAVRWLKAQGITTGVGGGRLFAPDRRVTRGEVATFLWRLVGEPRVTSPHGFTDIRRGGFYETAVRWMRAHGITTGVGGSVRFAPQAAVSRGELVTFLYRLAGTRAAWGRVAPPTTVRF